MPRLLSPSRIAAPGTGPVNTMPLRCVAAASPSPATARPLAETCPPAYRPGQENSVAQASAQQAGLRFRTQAVPRWCGLDRTEPGRGKNGRLPIAEQGEPPRLLPPVLRANRNCQRAQAPGPGAQQPDQVSAPPPCEAARFLRSSCPSALWLFPPWRGCWDPEGRARRLCRVPPLHPVACLAGQGSDRDSGALPYIVDRLRGPDGAASRRSG